MGWVVRQTLWVTIDYDLPYDRITNPQKYYRSMNPEITVKRFPIQGTGKMRAHLAILHYQKTMTQTALTTEEVLCEFQKRTLGSARLEHIAALTMHVPAEKQECKFVGLGSVWKSKHGNLLVPVLHVFGGKARGLGVAWANEPWEGNYCFIGIIEETPL